MEYKGYLGSVQFSQEDGVFFGQVLGVPGLLSYEGADLGQLEEDFHGVVDDYLALLQRPDPVKEAASPLL